MVRPSALHLSWHQRWLVHTSGWLLLGSGLAWLGVHYLAGAGAGLLPHPLEAWALRAHALAAWLAAFALGEIAAGHIPRGWHTTTRRRSHGQRRLGVTLCALALALVLSGYALMYWVPEPAHAAWGWAHTLLGVVMAAVQIVHGLGVLHRRPA